MSWSQYQVNESNTGFIPHQTEPAIAPSWTLQTGSIGYASPIIGPDGTVYIGTLDGQLFAVDPRGSIRWKKDLKIGHANSKVTASPAVDRQGNIYVIDSYARQEANHSLGETTRRLKIDSILHCFDELGNKKWQFLLPQGTDPNTRLKYSLSSPKILEGENLNTTIFMTMITTEEANTSYYLLAVSQDGTLLEKRQHASYPPEPLTGHTDWGGIWDSIWDFISSPIDFDTSGLPSAESISKEVYLKLVGKPSPSLAISSSLRNQQNPLIIFEDGVRKLGAYEWQNNDLRLLWDKTDRNFRYRSSPALFPNGTIAIGQGDGKVVSYNAADGKILYEPWLKAGKIVLSPVASFGRQLYIAAGDAFTVIDSGNELYKQVKLSGNKQALGAPALSANNCYLMTTFGLYTYSFEAVEEAKVDGFPGGVSTPAIANDGSIYAVDFKGLLWAFNRPGSPLKKVVRTGRPPLRTNRDTI